MFFYTFWGEAQNKRKLLSEEHIRYIKDRLKALILVVWIGKEPEDDFTRELDEVVQSVRKNEKWRALNVRWMFA